jgi:hypothetical protein
MSRGLGRLQRAIIEFVCAQAGAQRTPQRQHWRVEQLVGNVVQRGSTVRQHTARQHADARKRVRRACSGLVAAERLVRVGIGWTLPPETPAEARRRRKRYRISERSERQEQEQARQRASWFVAPRIRPVIDRATRAKLVKVLGKLGSDSDAESVVAAKQAERLRAVLGCSWNDLLIAG